MFRRKKQVVAPALVPAQIIFKEVPVPANVSYAEGFEYQGYRIREYVYRFWDVEALCTSCGGPVRFHRDANWQEIKSEGWWCGPCVWYHDEHKEEVTKLVQQIEELEALHESLLDAFTGLPGTTKLVSLSDEDLQTAGLILRRARSDTVLSFVLIDYSREDMHRLVTAVSGRLEPFSRGFELFLAYDYYKLFPGSYGLNTTWGGYYNTYQKKSYLDELREQLAEKEEKAQVIEAKIAAHRGQVKEPVES